MFLSRRSNQAEYFDVERSTAELAVFFQCLRRINRSFGFSQPFERLLPEIVGKGNCNSLSILDVGAGDGTLGETLSEWGRARGWNWRVTNLDINVVALQMNPGRSSVAGSALELPFHDGSFDVVIASQMTHHLGDDEMIRLLRQAWRVARLGLLVSDLHRSIFVYCALWLVLRAQRHRGPFYADALLSVKRSWRAEELQKLAKMSEIREIKVTVLRGARVILMASKTGAESQQDY